MPPTFAANMVVARRAAYLDRSGLRSWIQRALMALPIESSKLFARKVQEARLWDAKEDEVDQRKAFLKPSSSGYHKQQTSTKGKSPAAGKLSAAASQAKQSKPKPPPQASSSTVVAPGDEGVGPNPLVPTRLSTHGRFCSFLAGLRPCRRAVRRLHDALASHPRQRLRPSDSQRGHSVRVPGETPSCGVPNTLYQECKKGVRVMPPCGGDGQQGSPRTGPATISRFLQQPLLGAKTVGGPEAGYKPKASKSIYIEVQDGDYQVYLESVVSKRLGDIHQPEGCVFPHSGTS